MLDLDDELSQALLADPAFMAEIEAQFILELAQTGSLHSLEGGCDVIFDAALMKEIGTQTNLMCLEQVSASLPQPRVPVYAQPVASSQRWQGGQRQQRARGGLLTLVLSLAALVVCLCILTSMVGGGSSSPSGRGQRQAQGRTSVVPSDVVVVAPPADLLKKYNHNPYVATAWQAAVYYHINPVYFLRQINQESGFNPNAESPAGAVGIAQFLPSTAAGMGFDPWDPTQALYGAALYMSRRLHDYGGDYAMALASYNGGTGAVQDARNACGANWFNCLPSETHHYVCIILNSC